MQGVFFLLLFLHFFTFNISAAVKTHSGVKQTGYHNKDSEHKMHMYHPYHLLQSCYVLG